MTLRGASQKRRILGPAFTWIEWEEEEEEEGKSYCSADHDNILSLWIAIEPILKTTLHKYVTAARDSESVDEEQPAGSQFESDYSLCIDDDFLMLERLPKPIPVRRLIKEMVVSEGFEIRQADLDRLTEAAKDAGILESNAAIGMANFRHDPSCEKVDAMAVFVGAFELLPPPSEEVVLPISRRRVLTTKLLPVTSGFQVFAVERKGCELSIYTRHPLESGELDVRTFDSPREAHDT